MKINGKKIDTVNREYVIIPRPDGDIVFICQAVLDMKPFEAMVPAPKPGVMIMAGGAKKEDLESPIFLGAVKQYQSVRYAYMILQSLAATPQLEWETVKEDDPSTWTAWEKELEDSKFSPHEINLIQMGVAVANSLNQDKLDAARNRFLASLVVEQPAS